MKTIENILDTNDNVYVWDDEKTLDVCYENTTFLDVMKKTKCLACDTHLVIGNEKYIAQISETVKGAKITCKKCNQKYFLHVLVSMTPNLNH